MSQQILDRYYFLPTIGRLSLCAVEYESSSHNYSAIYSACSSLARVKTRLMVRATSIVVILKKVGSSIEGKKQTSVCVTPHPSVLTPPPYENKQYYKGGTNDKTHDSNTRVTGVYRSDDASLSIKLDAENKNTEDDEYIDHPSIKNDRIDYQSHEITRKILLLLLFSLKVINLVLFNIDQCEKEILVVDYINERTETKDK